jgi:hypothetical protein
MAYKTKIDEYKNYMDQQPKGSYDVAKAQNYNSENKGQRKSDTDYYQNNIAPLNDKLAAAAQGQNSGTTGTSGANTPTMPTWNSSDNGWYQQMQDLMGQISNRQPFSFDLNANALYQQYKDQYMKQGQQAMQDTMGQAAALTGGYGSSYGQAVGNQAYNEYLTKLGEIVPELYAQERAAYDQEGQDLYNRLSAAAGMYDKDYGAYQDQLSNYWNQMNFNEGVRQFDEGMAFDKEKFQASLDQWAQEFGLDKQKFEASLDQWAKEFGLEQDKFAAALDQWEKEFEYGKERDQAADDKWEREFGFSREQWEASLDQWAQEFGLSRDQFLEGVRRYNEETEYERGQDAYSRVMTMLQNGYMPTAEELQAAGVSSTFAQYLSNYYRGLMSGSGSTGGNGGGSTYSGGGSSSGGGSYSGGGNNSGGNTTTGTGLSDADFNNLRSSIMGAGTRAEAEQMVAQATGLSDAQRTQLYNLIKNMFNNNPKPPASGLQ